MNQMSACRFQNDIDVNFLEEIFHYPMIVHAAVEMDGVEQIAINAFHSLDAVSNKIAQSPTYYKLLF